MAIAEVRTIDYWQFKFVFLDNEIATGECEPCRDENRPYKIENDFIILQIKGSSSTYCYRLSCIKYIKVTPILKEKI